MNILLHMPCESAFYMRWTRRHVQLVNCTMSKAVGRLASGLSFLNMFANLFILDGAVMGVQNPLYFQNQKCRERWSFKTI